MTKETLITSATLAGYSVCAKEKDCGHDCLSEWLCSGMNSIEHKLNDDGNNLFKQLAILG